jgi:F0F1-type ATP synthase membrane subunit b/b'
MPTILRSALLLVLAVSAAFAAEAAGHGDGDPNLKYKLVNFAILAAGIAYLFVKVAFPAFRNQQKQILDGMAQAEVRAKEAAAQAAEIDKRMAGLEAEVAVLREKSRAEMAAEAERITRETEQSIEKIRRSAESEIAAIGKAARQQLKRYSADLALDLAKKKIESRMDGAVQAELLARFGAGLTPEVLEKN